MFLLLANVFAWVEASAAPDGDLSTGSASRGPLATGVALLAVFVVGSVTASETVPALAVIAGSLAMLGGIALRRAAMLALGPAFVSEPRPTTARDRVRHGPYRRLAHPSEWGLLAIAGGSAAVLGSLAAALLWGAVLVPLVAVRMRRESRSLAAWE